MLLLSCEQKTSGQAQKPEDGPTVETPPSATPPLPGSQSAPGAPETPAATPSAPSSPLPTATPGQLALTVPASAIEIERSRAVLIRVDVARANSEQEVKLRSDASQDLIATDAVVAAGDTTRWITIAAEADAALGDRTLTLSAESAGVRATGTLHLRVVERRPSANDLIAKALADKKISEKQALLYRGYAFFGDPRLPQAYSGLSNEEGTGLFESIQEILPSLSPAEQAEFQPFLLRPTDPNSAYAHARQRATPGATPP